MLLLYICSTLCSAPRGGGPLRDTTLHSTMNLWCLIINEVLSRGVSEAAGVVRAAGVGWKGTLEHKQGLRKPTTPRVRAVMHLNGAELAHSCPVPQTTVRSLIPSSSQSLTCSTRGANPPPAS